MKEEIELPDDFVCIVCGRGFPDDGYIDAKEPRCIPCYAQSISCEIKVVQ